uniref:Uncharacterized protein n=1 Tax=uncultured marine virus TaxID=186617 RepID=A0A0F7L4F3_9VIRU|nr:hypothetical protein [uncultured marine virus]
MSKEKTFSSDSNLTWKVEPEYSGSDKRALYGNISSPSPSSTSPVSVSIASGVLDIVIIASLLVSALESEMNPSAITLSSTIACTVIDFPMLLSPTRSRYW